MSSIPRERLYLIYPETDGEPMAENTLQFEWIVLIKLGLEACFAERDDVFIAGDLFWYPVEGRPDIRLAPDVLVAFGRPKGHRGSYLQWLEEGVSPQIVFEILSPGNRPAEMARKFEFYERYGVQEYYLYDPDKNLLTGYLRRNDRLEEITSMPEWRSPRLGIRFDWTPERLQVLQPDGQPFRSYLELLALQKQAVIDLERQHALSREAELRAKRAESRAQTAESRAENAESRAENAESRAETAEQLAREAARRAESAEEKARRLAEQLRRLGIDPEES